MLLGMSFVFSFLFPSEFFSAHAFDNFFQHFIYQNKWAGRCFWNHSEMDRKRNTKNCIQKKMRNKNNLLIYFRIRFVMRNLMLKLMQNEMPILDAIILRFYLALFLHSFEHMRKKIWKQIFHWISFFLFILFLMHFDIYWCIGVFLFLFLFLFFSSVYHLICYSLCHWSGYYKKKNKKYLPEASGMGFSSFLHFSFYRSDSEYFLYL